MSPNPRRHLTYANITATLALFIALGGGAYAAFKLPRDSVGSAQIRRGAVGSNELRDRSIRLADISRSARASLRGATGSTGASGPAGAPASRYFAVVSASGQLLRGNATGGGHGTSVGTYTVSFAQPMSSCAYVATVGSPDSSTVVAGRATVSDASGAVAIQTYDAAGNPSDLPFHLIASC